MTTILMYHAGNQHIEEVPESDSDKYRELGWRQVEKYDLIAMHNPATNEHKTVLRAEAEVWKRQGFYGEPTFRYHPEEAPNGRIFPAEVAAELLNQGWYDSPAKFGQAATDALVEKAVKAAKAKVA